MKLLSHWNLRDEIKANYGNDENGLAKQRTIQKVMERIVDKFVGELQSQLDERKVKVELTPYDLTKGRITYRTK